ncbi:zonular occludens toxin, partial [Vibrio sp. 10N.286.49.E1]
MIYLRTGLPGASKSLNSLREIVNSHNPHTPYFYNNIKLLMLDMDVCQSFSGWFYGWHFRNLKDKAMKRKLIKILTPIHENGDFVTLEDVPFLRNHFDSHNHFSTWLYWVKRVYRPKQLTKLDNLLGCMTDEQKNSPDAWEAVKVCNLHFTHFDDPNLWYELPTKSVILV